MTFSGQVHDAVEAPGPEQLLDQTDIADVAMNEHEGRVGGEAIETGAIAGISERIEHHDHVARMPLPPEADKVRADKAGTSGDENGRHRRRSPPAARSSATVWAMPRRISPVQTKPASRKRCGDTS